MEDTIKYDFYKPGDEESIITLLKNSFPGWKEQKQPIETWKWKYLDTPIKSFIRVVKDNEKVVAVDHKKIIRTKIGDKIHLTAYSDDVAVDKEYRVRGIYSEMLKFSLKYREENGVTYSYYSTINPIVSTTDTKSGFKKFPCDISHLIKIIKPDIYLKGKNRDDIVTKIGVKALTGYTEIKHALSPPPIGHGKYKVVESEKFDERLNEFWGEIKDSYDYIIEKTPEYLNWRIKKPGENNQIMIAVNENKILGYIIVNMEKGDGHLEGKISELLTLSDRLDVANDLVKNACDQIEKQGAVAIYYPVTKGHPYEDLIQRHGFIDASRLKSSYFYYYIHSGIDTEFMEKIQPQRVQLQHF
jgi:GNAT superfamily N-acetyltransferase